MEDSVLSYMHFLAAFPKENVISMLLGMVLTPVIWWTVAHSGSAHLHK